MRDDNEHIDTVADQAKAAAETKSSTGKKGKRRKGKAQRAVKEVIQGRSFLSWDFFKRNAVYVVAATVMMLMYISNKFVCQNYMQQVINLKLELENAKTDCVNASANYNSQIRESRMITFVDTFNIHLTAPEQPPYHLTEK